MEDIHGQALDALVNDPVEIDPGIYEELKPLIFGWAREEFLRLRAADELRGIVDRRLDEQMRPILDTIMPRHVQQLVIQMLSQELKGFREAVKAEFRQAHDDELRAAKEAHAQEVARLRADLDETERKRAALQASMVALYAKMNAMHALLHKQNNQAA